MIYCGDCIHLDVCKTAETCDGCVARCKHFWSKKPGTPAQQLRAMAGSRAQQLRVMTDEQLAAALYDNADCPWCRNLPECSASLEEAECIEESKCIACVLKWLQER